MPNKRGRSGDLPRLDVRAGPMDEGAPVYARSGRERRRAIHDAVRDGQARDGGAAPQQQLTNRRKQRTLLACILGSAVVFLDGTLVNVALPAIRAELHGGLVVQEWVVDAYLLTLGSLILVGGSLGDVLGRRRVFAAGVSGFGVASLLCGLAPDGGLLIAARALQGIAGALLVPSTLALIMDTFSEHERAAAIGSWTGWTGIATVLGPLVGGTLVQVASWRWIFFVNLPLVAATLWLVEHAPRGGRAPGARVDWTGGALCALGLAGPIFALIEQPRYGWSDPLVWVPLVAGCALLAAFLAWERRARTPMLPFALFRVRNFSAGNLATLSFYAGLGATTFFLVVFLQQVAGYSPVDAGLSLMPASVVMFLTAKRFGALADRHGPRFFMGVGPLIAGGGLLLLLRVGSHAGYLSDVFPAMMLFAIGLAMTVAPLTAAVLASVEAGHSGVASGVNNAIARIASLIAVAAVGAAVAGQFSSRIEPLARTAPPAAVARAEQRPLVVDVAGFPPAARAHAREVLVSASVDSFHVGVGIAAGLAILAGLISLIGVANPSRRVAAEDCSGGALYGASADCALTAEEPAAATATP
jgi:EmrB/QacA subfamily drug resistance transporter